MKFCKECSFPKKFANYFDWRTDGTIISRDQTGGQSQIVFLPSGEFEELFKGLSSKLGIEVDRFLIQAQKNMGKTILENLPIKYAKRLPAKKFFRPQWIAKLIVKLAIAEDIAGLGDGRISLDSYIPGEKMIIKYENPCLIPLLVGGSLGIYESLEKMKSSKVEYRTENNNLFIIMSHGEEEARGEERLFLEEVQPGNGPLTYDKCKSCGVPHLAAETFSWNMKEGVITNKKTKNREVIVSVQSVNAILRELERELGEDILELLFSIQKELESNSLECAQGASENFWQNYLLGMGIRGLGYPLAFDAKNDSLKVEIGNAYNQVLYAAKLSASFEKLAGRPVSIEWLERKGNYGSYIVRA
ncbi:MAG: hypothetical protein PHP64_06485 [Actinomycetota bacterium]|nr:hypothetical protein [Actinomycetota bacterium]